MRKIIDPPAIVVSAEADLKQLFARINSRERRSEAATVQHAEEQGNDLLAAQAAAGPGNWKTEVEEKCVLSFTQVKRYTRFARWLRGTVTVPSLEQKISKWREFNDNDDPASEETAASPPETVAASGPAWTEDEESTERVIRNPVYVVLPVPPPPEPFTITRSSTPRVGFAYRDEEVKSAIGTSSPWYKPEHVYRPDDLAAQAARLGAGLVERDVLLGFASAGLMADFVAAVKAAKVPPERHRAAMEYVKRAEVYGKKMAEVVNLWWYDVSGDRERHRKRRSKEESLKRFLKRVKNGDAHEYLLGLGLKVKALTTDVRIGFDAAPCCDKDSVREGLLGKIDELTRDLQTLAEQLGRPSRGGGLADVIEGTATVTPLLSLREEADDAPSIE